MAYGSRGFYHFHFEVFHVKMIISLWLIYCYLVVFVVLASLFVEPILAHKERNIVFRIIVFDSFSQQNEKTHIPKSNRTNPHIGVRDQF